MKTSLKIIIFFLILICVVTAQEKSDFRKIENKAFTVGEKLQFDVNYGFVTAGKAVMEIPRLKKIKGRDAYYITFKVNSVSAFDPFYKVRDRYVTYLDKEGIFPWRFEQHIREGGYKKDFAAFFDQEKMKVRTMDGIYDIPQYANDIVSAFYYFRTLDYTNKQKGDSFLLENFYKNKVYPLRVVYLGKEEVTVDAGTFKCIMVEPIIEKGGLFKSEGRIIVWLTDDELRMPVKVKTKILIGSIDAELTSYEGTITEPKSKIED